MAADNGHIKSMNAYSQILNKESEKYEEMIRFNQIYHKYKNENEIYLINEEYQALMKERAYLNKMCTKQNDLKSIFSYREHLYHEFGVPINKKKAAKYFKKAAEKG